MGSHTIPFLHRLSPVLLAVGLVCCLFPRVGQADDVIADDLIVRGSVCAGSLDCVDGESFGTANVKVKSLGPVLKFEDSSTVVGEPTTDWQISVNNGANRFAIDDVDGGKTPFIIEANAPANTLYLNSVGRVGIGLATPAQNLHIRADQSPTLRFDQGLLFFTPQIWDMGGNDVNFFIRDFTNSSQLPLRIKPNTPTDTLVISSVTTPGGSVGRVGIGTFTPLGNLHIFGQSNQDIFNGIGPDPVNGPALNFGYSGSSFGRGSGFFNVRPDAAASPPNPSIRFATQNQQRMIITNTGFVGINNLNPSQLLDVGGNIRASGSFIAGATTLNVPDYVFAPDYQLMPLNQLEAYIRREQHLPEIPSAQNIRAQGVDLSTLQMQLLKKIEELTLYTIQQERTNAEQAATVQEQKKTIAQQGQMLLELQATVTELKGALSGLTARLASVEQIRTAEEFHK